MTLPKILAALALLVAPATLGVASMTDQLPSLGTQAAPAEDYGGEIVDTFEASFETPLTDGRLDLRVDRGVVHVEAWEEDAYKIVVVQEATDDQTASDHETVVTFEDASEGTTLDLTVIADRQGTYAVRQDGEQVRAGSSGVDLAIVAFVPGSIDYERVHACSGQESYLTATVNELLAPLGEIGSSDEGETGCVASQQDPGPGGALSVNTHADDGLDVTFLVQGLHGQELEMRTVNGAMRLEAVDFEQALAASNNGAITAEAIGGGAVRLASNNGAVHLEGAPEEARLATNNGEITAAGAIGDLTAHTNNGRIGLELAPESSSTLDLSSNNGRIEVHVPQDQAIGYAVDASTNNGQIDIELAGAEVDDDSSEYSGQQAKSARTQGYDDKPIQVQMGLSTSNGGILVTDGSDGGDEEDAAAGAPAGDALGQVQAAIHR